MWFCFEFSRGESFFVKKGGSFPTFSIQSAKHSRFVECAKVYSNTVEEVRTPAQQAIYKIMGKTLTPNKKIITDTREHNSMVGNLSTEDFTVPTIPKLPEDCQEDKRTERSL
jgi:hypothetical protein